MTTTEAINLLFDLQAYRDVVRGQSNSTEMNVLDRAIMAIDQYVTLLAHSWKPADKIPEIDERVGFSVPVIAICEGPLNSDMVCYATYHPQNCSWNPPSVKQWIYLPEDDKKD